ncbi:MAG: ABC transporter permease [Actinomycetota bacterium]|nr:ABC transporter permease [Actinomycetota bacterium]
MSSVTAGTPAAAPTRSAWKRFASSPFTQGSLTTVAFLILFAGYGLWLGDTFINVDARLLDVHQNAPILLLGLAVMVTLIAGQFDLSVGGMATLTTYLSIGLVVQDGWSFGMVLAACIAAGLIGGLINGLLVVKLGVNTFIATLGTGGVFLGLSNVLFGGTQLAPTGESAQLPGWFSGDGSLGSFGEKFPSVILWIGLAVCAYGLFRWIQARRPAARPEKAWTVISAAIVLVIAIVLFALDLPAWVNATSLTIGVLVIIGLILWVVLRYTTYGRYLTATGANAEAARLAGVKTDKETIIAFVIGGLLAASAGVLLAANQGAASPGIGTGFLLPAFAAAFLGTVIMSTGKFHVWGTLIGGTFLLWVTQGLIVGGLPFTWTDVVNGTVLVAAVAVSTIFRRRA